MYTFLGNARDNKRPIRGPESPSALTAHFVNVNI